jgi:hypothetical protein
LKASLLIVPVVLLLAAAPTPAQAADDDCHVYAGLQTYFMPTEDAFDGFLIGARGGCAKQRFGVRFMLAVGGFTDDDFDFGKYGMGGAGLEFQLVRSKGPVQVVVAIDGGVQSFGRGGVSIEDPETGAEDGELFVEPSGELRVRVSRVALSLAVGIHVSFNGQGGSVAPDLQGGVLVLF